MIAQPLTESQLEEFTQQLKDAERDQQSTNPFFAAMITGGDALDAAAEKLASQSYLIKGILPENAGLTVIYGPPGGGKSFCALDMALSIGTGKDYHGHKVKQKPVLYVAAEGQSGMIIRSKAWRKYYNIDSFQMKNFTLLHRPCTIDEPQELGTLLDAISLLPQAPGVIVIDTVARSMSGDENSTRDMSALIRACDALREETGACIILIHHTGKDETKGARGALALTGATDCMFKVYKVPGGDADIIGLFNDRMKDGELAPPMLFNTDVVFSGVYDSEGEERTSLILTHNPTLKLAKGQKQNDGGLKGQSKIIMDILKDTLRQYGETPSPEVADAIEKDGCLTPMVLVVHEDLWREESYKKGIAEAGSQESTKRKAFWGARKKLLSEGYIGCANSFYWTRK
jgi:hypothetical protein